MDLYAHRVVGWAFSNKPDTDLVIKALDMAYEQRGKPQGLSRIIQTCGDGSEGICLLASERREDGSPQGQDGYQ